MYIQIGGQNSLKFSDLKPFNISANIIAATYQINLTFESQDFTKIAVDLSDREIEEEICIWDKVCCIFKRFDWEKHLAKPLPEQKLEILDTLQDSVLKMCNKYNFDILHFEEAYQKVIESNFEHKVLFNKLTFAPNRKHKAAIEIDMRNDGTRVNVLFTNKKEEVFHPCEVIRLKPNYYFIRQLIYKGKWIDNERYAVSDKKGYIKFIASMNDADMELEICSTDKISKAMVLKKLEELKY